MWFLALAVAQAQPLPLELPGLPPLAAAPPRGDTRVVTADTPSLRFDGEELPGPTFTAGEQVQVVLVDGERARVYKDDRYGWVPVSALAPVAPAGLPPSNLLQLPPLLPPP